MRWVQKAHLMVIHREMGHAAAKLEELLTGDCGLFLYCHTASSTVCLVRLFFQFKGGNGKAVDEQAQIKGQLGFIAAVA